MFLSATHGQGTELTMLNEEHNVGSIPWMYALHPSASKFLFA